MKTYKICFIAFIFVCVSCKPINTSIGMRQVYTSPKSAYFKIKNLPSLDVLLQEKLQVFQIHSNSDTILYGKYGTIIYFHPKCLQKQISSTYCGIVLIQLKELYTKQALIRERAYTISNRSMLESDGALYIVAQTETGEELFIACEEGIEIQIPRKVNPNMIFFDGLRNISGNMNWEVSDSIKMLLEENIPGKGNLDSNDSFYREEEETSNYFIRTKKFGWINCDRFYDDPREKVDLIARFILPSYEKKCAEIQNYIVFDALMSVLLIHLDEFGQWICPSLPVGEIVTCISIQKSDQHLYYGIQKTKVGNSSLLISLKEVKEEELIFLLELNL
jgi:hypothetical protein